MVTAPTSKGFLEEWALAEGFSTVPGNNCHFCYSYPHSVDEKIEAQRGQGTERPRHAAGRGWADTGIQRFRKVPCSRPAGN